MPAGWVSAGVAALSYLSADDAQQQQSQGSANSDATQRYMYDTTRKDNSQFLQTGKAANNRLAYLTGTGGGTGTGAGSRIAGLESEIKTMFPSWAPDPGEGFLDSFVRGAPVVLGDKQKQQDWSYSPEMLQYLRDTLPQVQEALANKDNPNGSDYGSLTRNFNAGDLANDPIYQSTFQNALDNGNKGINQQASATGSMLSGNTLKALSRFGANTAATYGNDAYNRFTNNQNNEYNKLAGLSGSGQVASQQIGAAGQNAANMMSGNATSLGNARGASSIAKGNALTSGINSAYNAYQQNYSQSMDKNSPYNGTGYSNSDISGLQDYQGLY